MLTAGFEELQPLLERALLEHAGEEEWEETAIAALGLSEAAKLLTTRYDLVVTNVPYLGFKKVSPRLKSFAEAVYPRAKHNLANIFLDRCLELSAKGGVTQMVMPQNWLFLTSYRSQWEHLLKQQTWLLLALLGPGAFETISGEVVNVILLTIGEYSPQIAHILNGLVLLCYEYTLRSSIHS